MLMWSSQTGESCIVLHSLTSHLPETVRPMADLKFLCLRCELPTIQLAISVFLCTTHHSASPVPCKQTFYTASVCRLPEGEEEEQQRGGRREGWENKASIVVSPAGPGRAELVGASYVMWLAGPTFLFRAAAHTNPYWGTSPSLEEGVGTEGELWGNQRRRCDYKNFSLSSAPNLTHRYLSSWLLCSDITQYSVLLKEVTLAIQQASV